MITQFEYISEIPDSRSLCTDVIVDLFVSCSSAQGDPSYEIEEIRDADSERIYIRQDFTPEDWSGLIRAAQRCADLNAGLAYQEFCEGIHEYQGLFCD